MVIETAGEPERETFRLPRLAPRRAIDRLLNRDLPPGWRIQLRSGWPLCFLPLLLAVQVVGPSPVWVALLISLAGLYAVSYAWVRTQVPHIRFERQREGTMLVVGDSLQERFAVFNDSQLPLHWLEFADSSLLPGYNPRQVVSCGPGSSYQWRSEAQCSQRGVFRLGPHTLRAGDPFGLFAFEMEVTRSELLLVYPRVAHIPPLELPRGALTGSDRRRRAYSGAERATVVRAYRAGDSLRYVHWPKTARQGQLMVTDAETEPSGDLWIVLDVERGAQSGIAATSTLETAVILAASAAAEYLGGGERRSVGLLTAPAPRASAHEQTRVPAQGAPAPGSDSESPSLGGESARSEVAWHLVDVPPQPGKAQMWRILAALAPVQEGDLPLDRLLLRSRGLFSAGQTVLVITSDIGDGVAGWAAELLHLRRAGVASAVVAVMPAAIESGPAQELHDPDSGQLNVPHEPEQEEPAGEEIASRQLLRDYPVDSSPATAILTSYEIPVQFFRAGTRLSPALTYRRTRTVLRTTPSGGVVTQTVEEEVG